MTALSEKFYILFHTLKCTVLYTIYSLYYTIIPYYTSLHSYSLLIDATEGSSMKFRFHYKPIWNEILSIVSRDSRIIAVSSEYVLSELLTALIDFLRGARSLLYTIGKFLLLNHILYIRICFIPS